MTFCFRKSANFDVVRLPIFEVVRLYFSLFGRCKSMKIGTVLVPIPFLGEEKLRSSASLIACVDLLQDEIHPNFAFEGLKPNRLFWKNIRH